MASEQELRTVLSPLFSREKKAIWITANSYVCLDGDYTAEDRHEKQFELCLIDLIDTEYERQDLSFHASTLEEAIICLDFIVGLQDTHFKAIELNYKGSEEAPQLCPFGVPSLEKILQNSARRICFNRMIFTLNHCRTLASCGTETDLEFYECAFQDEGAAFVEASAARQDKTSGPAKLRFMFSLPFNDRNWALFLSQNNLDSLDLHCVDLSREVSYRAVTTAQVRCLHLGGCRLEDEGAALVESVKERRGPKELYFGGGSFSSSERLVAFIDALCGNTNLE
jgi:hypothetical protein